MATTIDKEMIKVKIETSLGEITVGLYNKTPKHRDNFVKLVNSGYYDGVLFHRVIKDFMIQTGDGTSKTAKPNQMLGTGDPGYTIEAEIAYPEYFHKKGALAAARTGDDSNPERRSSGSQFYIVTGRKFNESQLAELEKRMTDSQKQQKFYELLAPRRKELVKLRMANDTSGVEEIRQEVIAEVEAYALENPAHFTQEQKNVYTSVGGTPHLDGQYTVFGEVLSGMETVEKIEAVETGKADRPKADVKIMAMKVIE